MKCSIRDLQRWESLLGFDGGAVLQPSTGTALWLPTQWRLSKGGFSCRLSNAECKLSTEFVCLGCGQFCWLKRASTLPDPQRLSSALVRKYQSARRLVVPKSRRNPLQSCTARKFGSLLPLLSISTRAAAVGLPTRKATLGQSHPIPIHV